MRIDCSAPTRIDLAGGTYDIWPLYLFHDRAQTINAAISLRAHATLVRRPDRRVILISQDTDERIEAPAAIDLDVDRLPLIARLVRYFGADGLELTTRSESPVGAGIAGSSAMNIAVTSALAAWHDGDAPRMNDDELMTLSMNIEAQAIGVPTGVQDFRPALFGGIAALELGPDRVRRISLPVDPAELSRRLVLVYTGASRNSGMNNWDVMQRRVANDRVVVQAFDGIRDAATGMRDALVRGDWTGVALHLAREWTHRKQLAPGVSTPDIEDLLGRARAAGAQAGKICGAGGGGCLFCLVEPGAHAAVTGALTSAGATPLPISVEADGVRITRS